MHYYPVIIHMQMQLFTLCIILRPNLLDLLVHNNVYRNNCGTEVSLGS